MEVTNQDIDKLSKKEDIKKEIDKVKPQAEQLSKDPNKLEKFLIEAEEYCQKIPGVGDDLATIPTLIRLVRDYCNKSYTDIPTGTIIAIIAALIYVVSPVDIIPDELIPVIGFVDDAAVVKFCIEMIKNDLNKYKQWKENNKMSIKDLNEELNKYIESAGDKYMKVSYDGKEIDVYTITRYMGNIIPEDFDITKFKIEILDSQNL